MTDTEKIRTLSRGLLAAMRWLYQGDTQEHFIDPEKETGLRSGTTSTSVLGHSMIANGLVAEGRFLSARTAIQTTIVMGGMLARSREKRKQNDPR